MKVTKGRAEEVAQRLATTITHGYKYQTGSWPVGTVREGSSARMKGIIVRGYD